MSDANQVEVSDEQRQLSSSIGSFAALVAAGTPTPGGGSVAAYSGVLAAALGQMMCNLTMGKKKYAEVEPRLGEIKSRLEQLSEQLRELIAKDAASFDTVMKSYRLPKETEEQKAERDRQINAAGRIAASTPYETAQCAFEVLSLLVELAQIGNPNALSDVTVASQLARTAVRGAYYNIGVNLSMFSDRQEADEMRRRITRLIDEAEILAEKIESKMIAQI